MAGASKAFWGMTLARQWMERFLKRRHHLLRSKYHLLE
jgi:hypothetical protein